MNDESSSIDFRNSFFRICLYVAGIATLYQLILSIVVINEVFHIALSSALFIVTIASLVLWNGSISKITILTINATVWSLAFVLYWMGTSGIYSAPAYVFFVLVTVFIIVFPKPMGYYYAVILCSVCVVLTNYFPTGMKDPEMIVRADHYPILATQYLICLLVIAISLYFLKTNFDKERVKNEASNETLISLSNELATKRKELLAKRDEIENIKDNLELLVKERTTQLEEKHEQLSQYAYENAHTLRGALCNIISIVNLIKKEPNDKQSIQVVNSLNRKANDLDSLIYQVNNLLK